MEIIITSKYDILHIYPPQCIDKSSQKFEC